MYSNVMRAVAPGLAALAVFGGVLVGGPVASAAEPAPAVPALGRGLPGYGGQRPAFQPGAALRQLADGVPAEEAVDALQDQIGGMLDLQGHRAFDPQHQRRRPFRLAVDRPRPLDLQRLGMRGDVAAGGGGQEVITLSAGGTTRQMDLSTNALTDSPTFSATRSRCGGTFGMLVDTSGSIGSTNMANVRTGISQFVDAFAGTPIKLQVVRFSSTATTLGAGSGWSRYYDMLVESDVADLKSQVGTLTSSGSTNWEDALFRMFKNQNGTVQEVLPDTLIFFTDGMPTYNRLNASSSPVPPVVSADDGGLPAAAGTTYNQLSWNRANRIAREYDADVERFIGVFVGSDTAGTSSWLTPGPGYHLIDFKRGYHNLYEQGFHYTNWQRGYHLNYELAGTGLIYENYAVNYHRYPLISRRDFFHDCHSGFSFTKPCRCIQELASVTVGKVLV